MFFYRSFSFLFYLISDFFGNFIIFLSFLYFIFLVVCIIVVYLLYILRIGQLFYAVNFCGS